MVAVFLLGCTGKKEEETIPTTLPTEAATEPTTAPTEDEGLPMITIPQETAEATEETTAPTQAPSGNSGTNNNDQDDPAPTKSKPTEPKPTQPKPTAPAPTQPKPTGPVPTQPPQQDLDEDELPLVPA